MARASTKLSIALAGDEPPTEFRIFTAGVVDTKKGKFTFDAAAAKAVMDEYQAHGIDLMIDYDHASLSAMAIDPAESGKAAGWFNLELRNGELWAVNVRWTPPAADALRAKEWRFISPAFPTDDSGRIAGLLNVAITNLPATRQLQPLMAARDLATDRVVAQILAAERKLAAAPPPSPSPKAAPSSADPVAKALAALTAALGLPPNAAPQDVADALESYVAGSPAPSAGAGELSPAQLKICAENGITPAAFRAAKNGIFGGPATARSMRLAEVSATAKSRGGR